MRFRIIGLAALITLSGCGDDRVSIVTDPTVTVSSTPKPPLELVDISKVPPLCKSRFQEGHSANGEPNPVAKELVANGKDSIPFLIAKLDDETEMDHRIVCFWYRQYVGDVALIILMDVFQDETEVNSTIPGFDWDSFLERGDDRNIMGEEVLRRYIRKHGRQKIKQRWQKMWDENKDKIFWDEKCYCFKLRSES